MNVSLEPFSGRCSVPFLLTLLNGVACAALLTMAVTPARAADCAEAARTLSETVRAGLGTETAENSLRHIISLCPELAEAHFHLGVSLLERKHPEDAIASLKKALELKKDPLFLIAIGNAYSGAKQFDKAHESYSEALKYDAKSVHALQGIAVVAIKEGRYPEAEDVLRRAIQIAPDEPALFYNLGIVLEQTGRLDEALESYRAATIRRPSYLAAQLHLGSVALKLGHYEDGERALKPLTLQDAQNPLVWVALGAAAEGMGQLDAALSDVDKALALNQQLLIAQLDRAILLVKTGRTQEGRDRLLALIGAHPDYAPLQSALGWAYLQTDQLDQAENTLNHALELDPKDGFAQNNLGVVFSLRGDSERAKHTFEKAKELRPSLKEPTANIQTLVD